MGLLGPLLAGLALVIALNVFVAYERKAGADKVRVEWAAATRAQREKEEAQAGKAAEKLEAKREKSKVIYRTITKEVDKVVERPVYRSVCLEPDGLRLARCAIRGEGQATCKPDKPVPGAPLALRWDWSLGSALDYRLGGDLP